ncbi:MAG TPA: alpha/beta fold hydrolase, partial [Acidimicrobiales bacterium]|nr:alpha/beta fold hydrolase [Acidimicrobiales bacterium]
MAALLPVLVGTGLVGTGLVGTGLASPVLAGHVPAAAPDFALSTWHPCPDIGTDMRCATLSVPLDYGQPSGRHIRLALSEAPATAPPAQRQGILVVNPGGPGASGLGLAGTVAAQLPPALAAQYDIVGFDPRGVGSSVPAMHCEPGFFSGTRPDYVPASALAERALELRAETYAHACQVRYGWLLPHMTTEDTARDLDTIRRALGATKINYLGYSYGTYIGEVYATLFPQRVRRLVLDSTVDPKGVWWQDNIGQDIAGQARIEQLFAWTARYSSVYHLGTTAAEV